MLGYLVSAFLLLIGLIDENVNLIFISGLFAMAGAISRLDNKIDKIIEGIVIGIDKACKEISKDK